MKVKPVEKGKIKNNLRGPRMVKKMKTPGKKISGVVKAGAKHIAEQSSLISVAEEEKLVKKGALGHSKKGQKERLVSEKLGVAESTVKQAVKIVMDLYDEHKADAKATLLNENDAVFLQLTLMKKPEVPEQRRKFVSLRHGLFGNEPEVCLFVKDYIPYDKINRTPDEKIELTVERYSNILKMHGVECISTIMPLFQLRTEYDSYELKRKLVDKFDVFLCHSGLLVNDNFYKNVGIAFTKKNKVPIPVKFPHDLTKPDPKFNERVSSLIKSSWYTLKPHSDTLSVRVGNVSLTQEQIVENVENVLAQLTDATDDAVPGGAANIKSVMLKTSRSKSLPLYLNMAPKSSLPTPVLKSVRASGKAEEDELTTQLGKKVVVMPNGDVFVVDDPNYKAPPGWDSDEEEEFDAEDDAEEDEAHDSEIEEPSTKKQKKELKQKKDKKTKSSKLAPKKAEESDSDDSEAGEADVAEKMYFKMMEKNNQDEKAQLKRKKSGTNAVTKAQEQPQTIVSKKKVEKTKASSKKVKSPKTKEITSKGTKAKKPEPSEASVSGKTAINVEKKSNSSKVNAKKNIKTKKEKSPVKAEKTSKNKLSKKLKVQTKKKQK